MLRKGFRAEVGLGTGSVLVPKTRFLFGSQNGVLVFGGARFGFSFGIRFGTRFRSKKCPKGLKTEPTMCRCIDFRSGWTISSTLLPCVEKSRWCWTWTKPLSLYGGSYLVVCGSMSLPAAGWLVVGRNYGASLGGLWQSKVSCSRCYGPRPRMHVCSCMSACQCTYVCVWLSYSCDRTWEREKETVRAWHDTT